MDNRDCDIVFENGAGITVKYNPYPTFRHVDTRDVFNAEFRQDEIPVFEFGAPIEDAQPLRGSRSHNLIFDEFAGVDLDIKNYSFCNGWLPFDQYEFTIEDGRIHIREKKAPDFGEFSPSQELNDFVNTLTQG